MEKKDCSSLLRIPSKKLNKGLLLELEELFSKESELQ